MPTVGDALSEKQFERQVKDCAKLFSWLYYHTHRSQFSPAGFPDCVFATGDRRVPEPVIYAELKSEKGKLSEDQRRWLYVLARAGERVFVWKPSSLDQIIQVLR